MDRRNWRGTGHALGQNGSSAVQRVWNWTWRRSSFRERAMKDWFGGKRYTSWRYRWARLTAWSRKSLVLEPWVAACSTPHRTKHRVPSHNTWNRWSVITPEIHGQWVVVAAGHGSLTHKEKPIIIPCRGSGRKLGELSTGVSDLRTGGKLLRNWSGGHQPPLQLAISRKPPLVFVYSSSDF